MSSMPSRSRGYCATAFHLLGWVGPLWQALLVPHVACRHKPTAHFFTSYTSLLFPHGFPVPAEEQGHQGTCSPAGALTKPGPWGSRLKWAGSEPPCLTLTHPLAPCAVVQAEEAAETRLPLAGDFRQHNLKVGAPDAPQSHFFFFF